MNDKISLYDEMKEDLRERNITVIDINRKGDCILAKDKNDRALFIYKTNYNYQKVCEIDLLAEVSDPYAKNFRYLLRKNKLKLVVTESPHYCHKIVTADQYRSLKKIGTIIQQVWKAAIRAKQKIEINSRMDTVSIYINPEEEYFFQGDEGYKLINETRSSNLTHFCSTEQIILYQAQTW